MHLLVTSLNKSKIMETTLTTIIIIMQIINLNSSSYPHTVVNITFQIIWFSNLEVNLATKEITVR